MQVSRVVFETLVELRGKIREASEDSQAADFPLWLDQICIDQSNVREKNHQVARMGTIYQNAESVTAWLFGVYLTHEEIESTKKENGARVYSFAQRERWWQAFFVSYWTQLWSFQEILLSRHRYVLWHGSVLVSWEHLKVMYDSHVFSGRREALKAVPQTLLNPWEPRKLAPRKSVWYLY